MRQLLDGIALALRPPRGRAGGARRRAEAARPPPTIRGRRARAREVLAERLNAIAEETERGWSGRARSGRLCADARGARRAAGADPRRRPARLGRGAPARRARAAAERGLRAPGDLRAPRRRRRPSPVPRSLLEAVNAAGRKGVTFQRYKGLGEMNKDQLWETTLDREARSLLQVKIKRGRRGRRHFRQADGRRRRAAPRVHPGQRAERGESGRVRPRRPVGPFGFSWRVAISLRSPPNSECWISSFSRHNETFQWVTRDL